MRNILHIIAAIVVISSVMTACHRKNRDTVGRMGAVDSAADRYYSCLYAAPSEAERGLTRLRDSVGADSDLYYALTPHIALATLVDGRPATADSLMTRVAGYVERHGESGYARERLMSVRAVIHSLYGRNRESADDFMLAAGYALANRNPVQAVKFYANAGELSELAGNPARGIALLRKAYILADSAGVHGMDFSILTRAAGIYNVLGNHGEADRLYDKNLAVIDSQDCLQRFHFYSSRGNSYYYRNDYRRALDNFTAALSMLNDDSDPYLMAVTHSNLGECYMFLDSLDRAAWYIDTAVKEFDDLAVNDINQVFYLNSLRGDLALRRGDMNRARQLLTTIDPEAVTLSPRYVALHYHRLVDYYRAAGDYRRALENNIKATSLDDSVVHFLARNYADEINERYHQDTTILHTRLHVAEKDEEISRLYMWISLAGAALLVLFLVAVVIEQIRRRNNRRRITELRNSMMRMSLDNARNRISPHFIFNILNTELSSDNVNVRNLITLMRLNLELCNRQFITLGEELDFIRTYIDVVAPSLGKGFVYEEHIDPAINPERVKISAMLIQITVENAVKHGLMGDDYPGKRLKLSIDSAAGGLSVTVENTLSPERKAPSGTGTGLRILDQTISTLNNNNLRPIEMASGIIPSTDGHDIFRVNIFIPDGFKFEL